MKRIITTGVVLCLFCSLFLFGSYSNNNASNDDKLIIVATVIVKQEYKDEVLKAIKAVVDASSKEPGNIFYDVFEDVSNPLKFVFIETWKSQAAIDSHNKTAHFNEFVKAIDGKTSLDVSILKQRF